MSFGSKLKLLRLSHGLTQLELAEKIKLSKPNVSKYEADLIEPSLGTLAKLSSLFDVSVDYLIDIQHMHPKDFKIAPLTDTEEHVLSSFRKLNSDDQKYVIKTIDMVADRYNDADYDVAAFPKHKHINIEDNE